MASEKYVKAPQVGSKKGSHRPKVEEKD